MAIYRDTIYLTVPPPPPPRIPPHNHRKLIGKILGIVFGIIVFLILLGLLIWYLWKRKLDKGEKWLDVEFTLGDSNRSVGAGGGDDDEDEDDDDISDRNRNGRNNRGRNNSAGDCNIVGILPPSTSNMWPPQTGNCFPPYGGSGGSNVIVCGPSAGPNGFGGQCIRGGGFDNDVMDCTLGDDNISIYSITSSCCSTDCRLSPPCCPPCPPWLPPPRCPTPIRGRIDVVHHIPPIRVDVVGHAPPRVTYFEEEGGRRRVAGLAPVERAHRNPNPGDGEPLFNVRNLQLHKPQSSQPVTPSGSMETIGTFSSEDDNEPTTPPAVWPAKTSWLADYPARKSAVDPQIIDGLERRMNGANGTEPHGRTIRPEPTPSMQTTSMSSLDPHEIGMNILAGIMSQWSMPHGGSYDPGSGAFFDDFVDQDQPNPLVSTPLPSNFPLPPFRNLERPPFFEHGSAGSRWPTSTARIIEESDEENSLHRGRQDVNARERPATPIPRQGLQPTMVNNVVNGRGPRLLNGQQRRVHWADAKNEFQHEPFAPRPQRRVNWGNFGDIPSGFVGQRYPDPDF